MSGEARLPVAVVLTRLSIVVTTCFIKPTTMSSRIGAIGKEDENDESEHGFIVTSLSWQSHHLNSFEGRCRLANRRAMVASLPSPQYQRPLQTRF